jgi:serine/threonine protein kinase
MHRCVACLILLCSTAATGVDCGEDTASCLSTTLPPPHTKPSANAQLINLNAPAIKPGTVLQTPSGLQLELIQRVGLLSENSSHCLPTPATTSSQLVLRSVAIQYTSKQGLLLPPAAPAPTPPAPAPATRNEPLRLAPPPTYFTGLDVAVLEPYLLSTRIEDIDPKFTSNKHSYYNYEQYDKGSCGEVWKAKMKKAKPSRGQDEKENDQEEEPEEQEYILKRIFVHRGENVWLSGWREILFGKLLKGLPNVARFVEHFEVGSGRGRGTGSGTGSGTGNHGNDKEQHQGQVFNDLWLVFHDEGESLRNFLYSQNGNVVQVSPQWSTMKKNGDDTFTVIRDIMYNVLNGLKQIHGRGVTHRDIKPSNIVVRKSDPLSRPKLKLVDFGSSMHFHDRRHTPRDSKNKEKEDAFKSSALFARMYGVDGPTTYDMTEKYMPLDLRIQTLLLLRSQAEEGKKNKNKHNKNQPGRAFVPVVGNAMTTSIDMWSAGIVLLEMILGTDTPFVDNDGDSGRKRLKTKRKIINKLNRMALNGTAATNNVPVEQLVDVIVLIEGAKEYCILPTRPTKPEEHGEHEASGRGHRGSGTMLQKWLNGIKTAIVGDFEGQENANTGSTPNTKGAVQDDTWWDQIEPFVKLFDDVEGLKEECDDETILTALERRDPLHVGLSFMKDYEAKELIQLLRGLLAWDPNDRVSASEALGYPIFDSMEKQMFSSQNVGVV